MGEALSGLTTTLDGDPLVVAELAAELPVVTQRAVVDEQLTMLRLEVQVVTTHGDLHDLDGSADDDRSDDDDELAVVVDPPGGLLDLALDVIPNVPLEGLELFLVHASSSNKEDLCD